MNAIVAPGIPRGTERLRCCVTAARSSRRDRALDRVVPRERRDQSKRSTVCARNAQLGEPYRVVLVVDVVVLVLPVVVVVVGTVAGQCPSSAGLLALNSVAPTFLIVLSCPNCTE